jgi:hypothetical protein
VFATAVRRKWSVAHTFGMGLCGRAVACAVKQVLSVCGTWALVPARSASTIATVMPHSIRAPGVRLSIAVGIR